MPSLVVSGAVVVGRLVGRLVVVVVVVVVVDLRLKFTGFLVGLGGLVGREFLAGALWEEKSTMLLTPLQIIYIS